ncbi:hypothetical protein AVEN_197741-1 [Araneus ventricosus]|uniref:Uncharacterized protein n=1 Tax=Araneus ventricosus TaxID=182803 RepID=A0A4Y2CNB5_ARAVE|nr:hypothetical protein AVEN_197741-1 [Araneus ventricosus]
MVVEACAIGKPIYRNRHRRIIVQVAVPSNDGFLNFGIGSEMATCQVFLQRSEEMKITWCEIRAIRIVFQNIPTQTQFEITCNRGLCGSALSRNNRTTFERSAGRFLPNAV